jgi:hypothetical protein
MNTKTNNPTLNKMRDPKTNPVVIFLSAVVAAFVAGVTAWIFLSNQIDARTRSVIYDMNSKNELPRGPQGPPGPAGTKLTLRDPISAKNGETKSLGLKEDEGFCYLTYVSGQFNGGGEYAKVYVDNGVWTLHVGMGSGTGVYGTAQCIEYSPK